MLYWNERTRLEWIENDMGALTRLHKEVDRLWVYLRTGEYEEDLESFHLPEEDRIKEPGGWRVTGSAGWSWVNLAGLYLYGLSKKEEKEKRKRQREEFRRGMPKEWVDHADSQGNENFRNWVHCVDLHWADFVRSYNEDGHIMIRDNGEIVVGTLESLYRSKARPAVFGGAGKGFMPMSDITDFSRYENAETLWHYTQKETEAWTWNLSDYVDPTGERTWQNAPYWMRIGFDCKEMWSEE